MTSAPEVPGAGASTEQSKTIAFLSQPGAFGLQGGDVLRLETHGAHVFVAGDMAIKIKRAVRYAYLDFSTLELRRCALLRELEVNRHFSSSIYLNVMPITRDDKGKFHLGGAGEVVEWCLRMRRFEQSALLSEMAVHGLSQDVLKQLADEVQRSHAAAVVHRIDVAVERMSCIVDEIHDVLAETWRESADQWRGSAKSVLGRCGSVIKRRAEAGFVRRCHGDLHLGNIVLWEGRPTLFDALEFDENLATVDTLYDLAFLLMDLEVRGSTAAANLLLNRYLWRNNQSLDLEGLAVLPLFMSLRAGIRSMTSLQRAEMQHPGGGTRGRADARRYLDQAIGYLSPRDPVLVAIGGLSGTGKSTLAAKLAPLLGPSPGALHLRSDLERKTLFGADELDRLPRAAYSAEVTCRVYDALLEKSRIGLDARYAVVVDAVYGNADERSDVEQAAKRAQVPFIGLWLQAPPETMIERVKLRSNDASDATADVVATQLARGWGDNAWAVIDAGGSPAQTLEAAISAIGRVIPDAIVQERSKRATE